MRLSPAGTSVGGMSLRRWFVVSLVATLALGAQAASALTKTNIGDGFSPALAIGGDGKGLVVYNTGGSVKVAHCTNVACTSVTTASVGQGIGAPPELTIGADGKGLAAWVNGTVLYTSHCNNAACTAKTVFSHQGAAQVAYGPTDAATGGDGFAVVTFIDTATGSHRLMHCKDAACSSPDFTTIGPVGFTEYSTEAAVTTTATGNPLVAYIDEAQDPGLHVVTCTTPACTGRRSIHKIANQVYPNGIDIVRGLDGLPLVVYSVFPTWRTAHCSTATCSSSTSSTLSDGALAFDNPSAALDGTGEPMIAYGRQGASGSPALRLAHCLTSLCDQPMSFNLTSVPELDELMVDPSLALGSDGRPVVAFQTEALDVYVLHCETAVCFDLQPPL
jgi:hypothetical protein